MDKVDLYRQVFSSFRELCANGLQSCSFRSYCREHGVVHMRLIMVKDRHGMPPDDPLLIDRCAAWPPNTPIEKYRDLLPDCWKPIQK